MLDKIVFQVVLMITFGFCVGSTTLITGLSDKEMDSLLKAETQVIIKPSMSFDTRRFFSGISTGKHGISVIDTTHLIVINSRGLSRLFNKLSKYPPPQYLDTTLDQSKPPCPATRHILTNKNGTYEIVFDSVDKNKIIYFKSANLVVIEKCKSEGASCCKKKLTRCKTVTTRKMFAMLTFDRNNTPILAGKPFYMDIGKRCQCM